jgi:hypothetical protein
VSGPLALRCPSCGAPVTFRARFCAYCRAALDFRSTPSLAGAGRPARIFDLKDGISLPGTKPYTNWYTPKPGVGFELKVDPGRRAYGQTDPKLRDSIARITGVCHDPYGTFAIGARAHQIGALSAGYFFVLSPSRREVFARRDIASKDDAFTTVIVRQAAHEIAGVGATNTLEVRCADSLFEVYVNGAKVTAFEDAHFCFGEHAWAVDAETAQTRVTIEKFEVEEL